MLFTVLTIVLSYLNNANAVVNQSTNDEFGNSVSDNVVPTTALISPDNRESIYYDTPDNQNGNPFLLQDDELPSTSRRNMGGVTQPSQNDPSLNSQPSQNDPSLNSQPVQNDDLSSVLPENLNVTGSPVPDTNDQRLILHENTMRTKFMDSLVDFKISLKKFDSDDALCYLKLVKGKSGYYDCVPKQKDGDLFNKRTSNRSVNSFDVHPVDKKNRSLMVRSFIKDNSTFYRIKSETQRISDNDSHLVLKLNKASSQRDSIVGYSTTLSFRTPKSDTQISHPFFKILISQITSFGFGQKFESPLNIYLAAFGPYIVNNNKGVLINRQLADVNFFIEHVVDMSLYDHIDNLPGYIGNCLTKKMNKKKEFIKKFNPIGRKNKQQRTNSVIISS